ncbi:MAG: hypothetical protein H6Q59_420 [Firmicutes bacterium]|nr:hypothetical protein [Bacillota bacterium]
MDLYDLYKIIIEKLFTRKNPRYRESMKKGEGIIIHETTDGEIILENTPLQKEVMIMNQHNILINIKPGDINFERVDKLENPENAYRFVVRYGFNIELFMNGVALVWWTLYPDGRYFEDEDGFGGEDCNETTIYAYIDTLGNVVIPFRDMTSDEIKQFRIEAERKVSNQVLRNT